MSPLSRRTLLKGLGVAVPLPFLEAMWPQTGRAAENVAAPARMLVCHFGTGMNLREFFPQETGPDCALPRIVKPLEAWRKGMTILSGIQLAHGGGHTGDYTFLTGAEGWTSTGIKSGISPDQVVETYFLESRPQLLEIAAHLDRLDAAVAREGHGPAATAAAKLAVLKAAIATLVDGRSAGERTVALLELFAKV